jgi:hypothetical protein
LQEQDFNDATALNIFLDSLGNFPKDDIQEQSDDGIGPTSDLCCECSTTIEEICVKYSANNIDRRWHQRCLKCTVCRRNLVADQAMWSDSKQKVVCDLCARNRSTQSDFPDMRLGFGKVTLLMQFIFLLRVALARLGSILQGDGTLLDPSGIL